MDDPWWQHRLDSRAEDSAFQVSARGGELTRVEATADRVIRAITAAGFPPLVVEEGQVVLSGFVIEDECPGRVKVRWVGQPEVNTPPYRRTFLSVYSFVLLEAGLTIQYVADDVESHLICRAF
jgi:hypothetical protein